MYGQAEDFIVIVKEPSFVVPSLTIAANTTNQICHGTNVTFTATPTNGGSNPDYQWQKNGIDIGANVATYSDNELSDGDVISCRIRDIQGVCSAYWLTASNVITMSVSPTPVFSFYHGNTRKYGL